MIRKVNYGGKWVEVEFSKEEVEKIKAITLEENIKIAKDIFEKCSGMFGEAIIAGLVKQSTQHWVHRLDAIATKKAKKEFEDEEKGE